MSITHNLALSINSTVTGTVGLSAIQSSISATERETAATSDAIFTETFSLVGVTAKAYDLLGSLTDPLGVAVTFDTVEALYIKNNSLTDIKVGAANNVPFFASTSDIVYIKPGGYLYLYGSYQTTAGTGDLITLQSATAAADWNSGTAYTTGQVVIATGAQDGHKYKALLTTGNTNKAPETETTFWVLDDDEFDLIVIGTKP